MARMVKEGEKVATRGSSRDPLSYKPLLPVQELGKTVCR